MASLYKRDNVYYIKFYERGRRVRRSLKTNKKSEALRIKEQIERKLATGRFQLDQVDTPVEIFWDGYLEWAKDHKRPKTIKTEKIFWNQLNEFVKPSMLGDVIPQDIENFKAWKKQNGLKPLSINDALRHLQAIFNYATKLGYFSGANPIKGIQRYKLEKNPPRFLGKTEINRLLKTAQDYGTNIHIVFALGIYAGLRKSEIVNARWEWFDFDRKVITLRSDNGFYLKDSESRTIPLHEKLAKILEPNRRQEGYVFLSEKKMPGKYQYRYEFKRSFRRVVDAAKLPWVTPHVLRHTFASQLAIAGVSLYKISKWLGHSDIITTQIYAHLQTHDVDINRF